MNLLIKTNVFPRHYKNYGLYTIYLQNIHYIIFYNGEEVWTEVD